MPPERTRGEAALGVNPSSGLGRLGCRGQELGLGRSKANASFLVENFILLRGVNWVLTSSRALHAVPHLPVAFPPRRFKPERLPH